MRLKPWEMILLVIAAICVAVFIIARTIGARATSREGIVSRVARPGVAFWPEPIEVDVRIDARTLPTCADTGDVSPVQAALVIDRSGSMAGTPMVEARNAASDFVDLMDLQEDRDAVAVVAFDSQAYVRQAFTHDRGSAISAIQGLQAGGGTDIAAGLNAATQQIARQTVLTNTRQVIVLLSDGQSDPGSAIAAADAAKARGIWIFTIALGSADIATLSQIASSTDAAYATTDPTALMGIYSDIAAGIVGTVATDIAVTEYYNDARFEQVGSLYRTTSLSVTNPIQWNAPFMGARGRSMGYFLRPHRMGIFPVSTTSGQMSLVDCNGQAISQGTPAGPNVLVLFPVWLLLPTPLLALLWLFYRVIQALKPTPTGPVIAPHMRTGNTTGKKVDKKPAKKTGATIEHGRTYKPPQKR